MCNPCYQALYERDTIPRDRRGQQVRRMVRWEVNRAKILFGLNIILPGVGFSLRDNRITGVLCVLGFFLLALATVFWNTILPLPFPVWETAKTSINLPFAVVLILGYLGIQVYFYTQLRSRRS